MMGVWHSRVDRACEGVAQIDGMWHGGTDIVGWDSRIGYSGGVGEWTWGIEEVWHSGVGHGVGWTGHVGVWYNG